MRIRVLATLSLCSFLSLAASLSATNAASKATAQGSPYCGCYTQFEYYDGQHWWGCGLASYGCPGPPYEPWCDYNCNQT